MRQNHDPPALARHETLLIMVKSSRRASFGIRRMACCTPVTTTAVPNASARRSWHAMDSTSADDVAQLR